MLLFARGKASYLFALIRTSDLADISLRIVRAFLIEEQKIVKKVLKLQKSKEKASSAK